ncbi:MAG TPA: amino acid ABC transporter permease [Bacillota bacterium]|nr:amino acid ABC transporter permease [Bacillota bacterium]
MNGFTEIFPQLMKGISITVIILIGSAIMSYITAFIAGLLRLSRFKFVRGLTTVYVEVFRGTSLIVQLFWFSYALPMLFGIRIGSDILAAILAISLNYGAYMSEIVRGSILAVSNGQTEAGIALNMTPFQRMRLIIFPQAVRMMLPEFGNYLIQMLKATSLVSLIGLTDVLYYGNIIRSTNIAIESTVYLFILIFFFLLALPLIFLTRKLEEFSKKGVET